MANLPTDQRFCPVCKGNGVVPIYGEYNGKTIRSGQGVCPGCNGDCYLKEQSPGLMVWHPLDQLVPKFWQPVLATLVSEYGRTDLVPPFVAALRLANVKDKEFIYDNTGGMNREDGGYVRVTGYRVTHWMPYPEPCRG